MKYVCLGYYDKDKFEGMTESERNAMFDICFEYDEHLRAIGAKQTVSYRDSDWVEQVLAANGGNKVKYAVDIIGLPLARPLRPPVSKPWSPCR